MKPNQEPGTEAEIQDFCRLTYGVKFPMFEKTTVKEDNAHPFFAAIAESAGSLLTSHSSSGSLAGDTVTVTATGDVVSILPFVGTITVRASGSARIEQFKPQGTP